MITFFIFLTLIRTPSKSKKNRYAQCLYPTFLLYICTISAVYIAERFVLQETFLSLKIRGLLSRAVSNQKRVIMASVFVRQISKTVRLTFSEMILVI
jgi:hypothetical protein